MRGISVTEFGGPEVLRLVSSLPKPSPSAKQVLINVKAAGVNPVDTYIRSGNYANKPLLPYVPGKDGSGLITDVGADVENFKVGDRVWFFGSVTGSLAEYCVCDEENVGILPKNHEFTAGAMVGVPYLTAYRALIQKGKAKPGETVLIHGATGGVGTAAVQICLSQNINVIATAGSSDGVALLKKMGVSKIYNHKSAGYVESIAKNEPRVDVIIEMLANVNLENDCNLISTFGRIVVVGSRGTIEINPRLLMQREASITGCMLFKTNSSEKIEQMQFIENGLNNWMQPILWKTYQLKDAKDAHVEIIENSGSKGQIVVIVE